MKRLAIPFIVLVVVLATMGAASARRWTIGVIEPQSNVSHASSLAVSVEGDTYVSWQIPGSDELWWAEWTGSGWTKSLVAGGGFIACYPKIEEGYELGPAAAVRPDGRGGIVHACIPVDYATVWWTGQRANGNWTTEFVSRTLDEGDGYPGVTNVDLAFDIDGDHQAHIVFGESRTNDVNWAYFNGRRWVNEFIAHSDTEAYADGPVASIAFDPTNGEPAVAWNSSSRVGALHYSKYDPASGDWSEVLVTGGTVGVPSLAFTPDGTPWVAFQAGTETASSLRTARIKEGAWIVRPVDSTSRVMGRSPSLAMSGSLPQIVYHDQTNGDLRWARHTGRRWNRATIDAAGDVGEYPSLALTSRGLPRIAYFDRSPADLTYAFLD